MPRRASPMTQQEMTRVFRAGSAAGVPVVIEWEMPGGVTVRIRPDPGGASQPSSPPGSMLEAIQRARL